MIYFLAGVILGFVIGFLYPSTPSGLRLQKRTWKWGGKWQFRRFGFGRPNKYVSGFAVGPFYYMRVYGYDRS